VIGQPNFTTSNCLSTPAGICPNGIGAVSYDTTNQRLYLADAGNNRVLGYNANPVTMASGESAVVVLGQTNFTNNGSGTSQTQLNFPDGVEYNGNGQQLFITDSSNQRVLAFNANAATMSSGDAAEAVVGQADFASAAASVTQSGLNGP